MSPESESILHELPEVARLYLDACAREGERRGKPVGRHDPLVRLRVADILLGGEGEQIRARLEQLQGRRS